MTIVVVTHELASVAIIADRVAMMHEGKIMAIGTLQELKSQNNPLMRQFFNREPDDEELARERQCSSLFGKA